MFNKHKRPYNFGAGPSMLPDVILQEAQAELMNWQHTGLSVMEVGHRTESVKALMAEIEADLRNLLNISDQYSVLFLGQAARTQFAAIPMNLVDESGCGAYLISGIWSELAYEEARKVSRAYCIGSSKESGYTLEPEFDPRSVKSNTTYLYYTPNETINGVRISKPSIADDIPLIADMTSCLLTEPVNVDDYGLIFAGAQKNISIPGLTIVIIRNDLLSNAPKHGLPTMLDYRTYRTHKSLYATPPTFSCYLAGKMFKWIEEQGGIAGLYEMNCKKAEKLYHFIDESSLYECKVKPSARSIVNVCFNLVNEELQNAFLNQAEACGLLALKGHREVGGLRASIYNAMPMQGIDALIKFMNQFSKENK